MQVIKSGLPESQARVPAGSTPAGTDHPSSHHLSRPSMKKPYDGACLKQHSFIGADPIVLLGNHRGARGRGGFGYRTQDRNYRNGHGSHWCPVPDPQLYTLNRLVYPGPPQNPHPHPPVNPSVFYNLSYQQGYGHLPQASHLFNQNFPAPLPPANQNQNTGHPGMVLNGRR